MIQEEFEIQGESKRTVIRFFTTWSGQTTTDNTLYYVIADYNNIPLKLVESKIELKFGLNFDNYNIPLSAITSGYKIYSGTSLESDRNSVITESEKQSITNNYINTINKTANQNNTGSIITPFSTVFFDEYPFNDYYLNIKVNRSINTLDTLNIYNVPVNEATKFTNDTGVLFGKIDAIQVIKDDSGNKIKIPLRDTVVGIFNPSDEIPSIGSLDQNGDRITLSLYENLPYDVSLPANLSGYPTFQSFLTDVNYSKNDFENLNIPAKYKYTTITNENGEFVLHNIPIGQQTLMIEVDLLKLGLNPEEVALNFFPYPTVDDPNVSTIPHYYFNQFPINIVPSWGDLQTGYTEANLSIVLDLRKWITYYTYPINNKNKVLEKLLLDGVNVPLTVGIRDMTKVPFSYGNPPKVELVKIPDIYDRNLDLYDAWNNEFKIKNNKIEFNTTNFNAFKLPANLYDPNGIGTDKKKGVWIGSYQIKIFYPTDNISYQSTGYDEEWNSISKKILRTSYYYLNRYPDWQNNSNNSQPDHGYGASFGIFPYEKAWSLNYPEPYKITKKPEFLNPYKQWDNSGNTISINGFPSTQGEFFLQPRYLDGDLVGGPDIEGSNANGYGLQDFAGSLFGNNFSREVTRNEIWRYDGIDYWGDTYSNGYPVGMAIYDQNLKQKYNGIPNVPSNGVPYVVDINGNVGSENFQRLEAGYAYWVKPTAWPRIKNEFLGDHLLNQDFDPRSNHNNVYNGYQSYYPNTYLYLDEITLKIGNGAPLNSKFGRLNYYRVEKPFYVNIKKPPFVEKFIKLEFQRMYRDNSKDDDIFPNPLLGVGSVVHAFDWLDYVFFDSPAPPQISIQNIGSVTVTINGVELKTQAEKGGWDNRYDFYLSVGDFNADSIELPANDSYDPITNSYRSASYIIYINSQLTTRETCVAGTTVRPIYKYDAGEIEDIDSYTYYLVSRIPRVVGLGPDIHKAALNYHNAHWYNQKVLINGYVFSLLEGITGHDADNLMGYLNSAYRDEFNTVLSTFKKKNSNKNYSELGTAWYDQWNGSDGQVSVCACAGCPKCGQPLSAFFPKRLVTALYGNRTIEWAPGFYFG